MLTAILLLFLLGLLLLLWAQFVEPYFYELNHHQAILRKSFPRPIRILHLSDTHFAYRNRPLSKFFDRLAKEEVDFVFITGDVMDCQAGIDLCIENLKKLKPRFGTYLVFGNHDYYDFRWLDGVLHNFPGQRFPRVEHDVFEFKRRLEEEAGVHVLMNETVEVDVDGTPMLIHGLDDATTGHANIRKTMANYDPDKVNVLLTHTIDVFLDIGKNEIDASFSGHSHGGQVRVPFVGAIITHTRLGKKYAGGVGEIQGATYCVSKGLSSNRFIKLRFLCRPEAIVMTLVGTNP